MAFCNSCLHSLSAYRVNSAPSSTFAWSFTLWTISWYGANTSSTWSCAVPSSRTVNFMVPVLSVAVFSNNVILLFSSTENFKTPGFLVYPSGTLFSWMVWVPRVRPFNTACPFSSVVTSSWLPLESVWRKTTPGIGVSFPFKTFTISSVSRVSGILGWL